MAPKPEILFEWTMPREILESEAKKRRLRNRKFFPFVFILILGVEVALFIPVIFILQKSGSEGATLIPHFIKVFFFAGVIAAGIPLVFSILDSLVLKYQKITYQITSEAFIKNMDGPRKIKWNKLQFIGVEPHDDVHNKSVLKLFYKKAIFVIPLPEPEISEEILSFVRSRIEPIKDKSLINEIIISRKQKTVLLISTGIYIACVLWILHTFKYHIFNENIAPLFFSLFIYIPVFVGPGTIGMLFFYRTLFWRRKDLQRHAIFYNICVFLSVPCLGFGLWLLETYLTVARVTSSISP